MTPKELAELEGISVAAATKRLQRQKKMSSSGQGGQVDIAKVDKCPVDKVDISEMSSTGCPLDIAQVSTSGQVDISEMSTGQASGIPFIPFIGVCGVPETLPSALVGGDGDPLSFLEQFVWVMNEVEEHSDCVVALRAENRQLRSDIAQLRTDIIALQAAVHVLQSAPTPIQPTITVASAEMFSTIEPRFIPPPDSGLKPDFVVEYEGQPKAQVVPSQVQIALPERTARPEPGPDELRRKDFYDESMSALLKAKKPAYSIHVDRIIDRLGIEPNANGYFTRAQVAEVANG